MIISSVTSKNVSKAVLPLVLSKAVRFVKSISKSFLKRRPAVSDEDSFPIKFFTFIPERYPSAPHGANRGQAHATHTACGCPSRRYGEQGSTTCLTAFYPVLGCTSGIIRQKVFARSQNMPMLGVVVHAPRDLRVEPVAAVAPGAGKCG